jgi:2-polyprenyl-3-methyl-5-hydroxy-6-metoxy-1,4-benzoquinol methylase
MMPNERAAAEDHPPSLNSQPPDWNTRYVLGDTPWDRHSVTHVLDRVLPEWRIQPCRPLEMGCGTGGNAIHLARLGYDVTAFDLAPRAIVELREAHFESPEKANGWHPLAWSALLRRR